MDKQDIVKSIKDKYDADVAQKMINLLEAEVLIRGYNGEWFIGVNFATNTISDATFYKKHDYIPRTYTNKFADEIDNSVSMITRNDPLPIVIPNSDDYQDKMAAILGEEFLKYKNFERNDAETWELIALWRSLTGTAYRKVYWDTTTKEVVNVPKTTTVVEQIIDSFGNPVPDPATGNPQTFEREQAVTDANGKVVMITLPEGDISACAKSIFEVSVDPAAKVKIDDGKWILDSYLCDRDWAKEQFARDRGKGFTGDVEKLVPFTPTDYPMQALLRLSAFRRAAQFEPENGCLIREYYEAPCKKYPRGRMVVTGNDKEVLFDGDNPYFAAGRWHGYTAYHWRRVPGKFLSKPLGRDLYPLQKRLNGIDTLRSYTRQTTAIPQKAVIKGSGIKKGEITGRPGQVYEVLPHPLGVQGAIMNLPGQGLDQSVAQERQDIVNDMSIMSGSYEAYRVSRSGRLTAMEYSLTDEYAINKMAPIIKSWERSVADSYQIELCLVGEKYREPRGGMLQKLKAFSTRREIKQMEKLSGDEFRKNYRVRVEAGSTLPKSKAAKQDLIVKTFPTGLLGDINDPVQADTIRQELGIFNLSGLRNHDRELALWENEQLELGVALDIHDYDDHLVHQRVIDELVKSPYFYTLPDAIQKNVLTHRKGHSDAIAQNIQGQQQMQMAALVAEENAKGAVQLQRQQMRDQTTKEVTGMKNQAKLISDIIGVMDGMATVDLQHRGAIARDEITRLLDESGKSNQNQPPQS